jgi:hypothetical protein
VATPACCTVNAVSIEPPTATLPRFTLDVGVTERSVRAGPLALLEQGLSLPLVLTAVTWNW